MNNTHASRERRPRRRLVVWTAVLGATTLAAGVTVQWFTNVPNEAADRMELVSASWSNQGTPVLTVVTQLLRSDGRRVYPRGGVWTRSRFSQFKVSGRPDLEHRSAVITAEIHFSHTPRQPVVLECYALQPRATRGMMLVASWERKLLHRTPRWLQPPVRVRLPDIALPGPAMTSQL